jgi:hypothetical protein
MAMLKFSRFNLTALMSDFAAFVRDRAILTKWQGRWKSKISWKNYLTIGKNVDALLLCHNFLPRFIP